MTPREIVLSNIEFRCPDRIGLNFTQGEGYLNDFAEVECWRVGETRKWLEGDFEYYTDVWGNVWHRMKHMSAGGEVYKPLIEDWRDLDKVTLPDLANPAHYGKARDLGASETDLFRVGGLPGFPFAICRYLRKMQNYFMDLIAERARIDVLHDRVTTLLEGIIDRYGEARLDAVTFCEDLGTQDRLLMSLSMWRDIFAPLYERLTGRAHRHGMKVIQHSCGYNWELIDDLCAAGIDCLQFDQPCAYDLPALAKKLKTRGVGLFSPCDIQKVLPTGNREFIERETARLVETFRGGFIAKNYSDLHGIGVEPQWDNWAYETFVRVAMRL